MPEDKPPPPSPYSPVIQDLVAKASEATGPDRANLMMTLAAQFHQEHDLMDEGLDEVYHSYFEEYSKSRMEFHQAAIRLARLAIHEVEKFHDDNGIPLVHTTISKAVN